MERQSRKKVTIKDVAQHCGVSLATASRVLSGSDYPVGEKTRKKILAAAQKLGYIPNSFAQSLRSGASDEIAVVLPTLANPFYTSLVSGFETAVSSESGTNLVLYLSSACRDKTLLIRNIAGRHPKGILIAAPDLFSAFRQAAASGILQDSKLVFADCPSPQDSFNSVCFDYKKGTALGTEHLIKLGHRDIVFAGLTPDRESRRLRMEGFKEAMLANSLDFTDDSIVLPDGPSDDRMLIETGERLAELILMREKRPTAIAAVNDMVAFGILRHFSRVHVRVPEDISVIGFDDTVFCDACNPPLTTVKVQDEQIGRMAGMLLLNELNHVSSNVTLYVEPSIVERQSAAPPKK